MKLLKRKNAVFGRRYMLSKNTLVLCVIVTDVWLDNNGACCNTGRCHIRLWIWIHTQYNDQFILGSNELGSHNKTSIVHLSKYIPMKF